MTEKKTTETSAVLAMIDTLLTQVRAECASQLDRWGVQTHPSYQGETSRRSYERSANYYKQIWDAQDDGNAVSWDIVLLEEVYEALSEPDPVSRHEELIQVAAVALSEIASIAMRNGQLTGEIVEPTEDEVGK